MLLANYIKQVEALKGTAEAYKELLKHIRNC
jgi:hypothetical protein